MELIDKSVVVAEIERRKKKLIELNKELIEPSDDFANKWAFSSLDDILSFLDTLEVKEVDLEKHLKEDIEDVFFDLDGVAVKGATYYITVEDVKYLAKHFYELGLNAQKGK